MPIYSLDQSLTFPDPELADPSGIIAVGGDLTPERLLLAYRLGIFPWYSQEEPIIWWSPDPRMILYPENLKVSKSMKRILKKKVFDITFDQDFESVIKLCQQQSRKGQRSTWITPEMLNAYIELYQLGYAHSVEVLKNNLIVGGLYGVSLGGCFFGESMFSKESNASKAGFITLVNRLKEHGFSLIDCQVYTSHLASLGAEEVNREKYLNQLADCLKERTLMGNWEQALKV